MEPLTKNAVIRKNGDLVFWGSAGGSYGYNNLWVNVGLYPTNNVIDTKIKYKNFEDPYFNITNYNEIFTKSDELILGDNYHNNSRTRPYQLSEHSIKLLDNSDLKNVNMYQMNSPVLY